VKIGAINFLPCSSRTAHTSLLSQRGVKKGKLYRKAGRKEGRRGKRNQTTEQD